jgi:glycosyltransferase involved in cell wall biosynthesis
MRISVAMTVCDAGEYLRPQLESIDRQTRAPDEMVVVDDASVDGSAEVLGDWASAASFPVRVQRHAQRTGSTMAFSSAIALCEGDVIALCDHDDVWSPRKLELMAESFATQPGASFVFSDGELIDGHGAGLGRTIWSTFGLDPELAPEPGARFLSLAMTPQIPGCTIAFARGQAGLALPFPGELADSDQPLRHDSWLVSLLEAQAPSVALREKLVGYRVHGRQQVGLVGAPQTSLLSRVRDRPWVRRGSVIDELGLRIAGVRLVRDRLATAQAARAREALAVVDDALAHLEARVRIGSDRRGTFGMALCELRSGRYGRYSSGVLSMLADVARR